MRTDTLRASPSFISAQAGLIAMVFLWLLHSVSVELKTIYFGKLLLVKTLTMEVTNTNDH
jgi:hypothetical protein